MLEAYPTDTAFLLEYGLINYAQGEYAKASSAIEYVLILEPENVSAKEIRQLINQGISQQGSSLRK